MYAIQNIKTGKFVYGTDYRYGRIGKGHNQRTSKLKMLTYTEEYTDKYLWKFVGCSKSDGQEKEGSDKE